METVEPTEEEKKLVVAQFMDWCAVNVPFMKSLLDVGEVAAKAAWALVEREKLLTLTDRLTVNWIEALGGVEKTYHDAFAFTDKNGRLALQVNDGRSDSIWSATIIDPGGEEHTWPYDIPCVGSFARLLFTLRLEIPDDAIRMAAEPPTARMPQPVFDLGNPVG